MQQPSKYSAARLPGKEHVPLYPKGFIALRIVQLVLGVIILGMTGFLVAIIPFSSVILMLFTALATMIATIYYIVVEFAPKAVSAYNYWAVMGLDIFLLIFWLISFALVASLASIGFSYCAYVYDCYDGDYIYGAILATCAGLGGVQFALHIVSLSIHGVMVHRHRAAGLHCNPGGSSSSNGVVSADKMQMPMPMPMQPQQPQAMYPMQPQHTGGFVQQQMPQQYVQGPPVAGFFQQAPTAAPLSSQTTGGSYIQVPVQQQPQLQQQMPMPQQQQQHQVPPPLNGAQQLYGSA